MVWMKEKASINFDILLAAALWLFSLGAFWLSFDMFLKDATLASSGSLPLGASGLMIILSSLLAVKTFRIKSPERSVYLDKRMTLAIALFAMYVYFIEIAGFYATTFVFTSILSGILGKTSARNTLIFSAALVLLLWIVFGTVFKVSLP